MYVFIQIFTLKLDAPSPWGLYFQDSATPQMEGLVELHDNIMFYLVAILFIIFDLEIAYLFPWALSIWEINEEGIISMIIFLFILTIGFVLEIGSGAIALTNFNPANNNETK